jgi:hypothetical protein
MDIEHGLDFRDRTFGRTNIVRDGFEPAPSLASEPRGVKKTVRGSRYMQRPNTIDNSAIVAEIHKEYLKRKIQQVYPAKNCFQKIPAGSPSYDVFG